MIRSLLLIASLLAFIPAGSVAVAEEAATPVATEDRSAWPERITIAFQKQKDPRKIRESADRLSKELAKRLGIDVNVQVPMSYGASVQALVSNTAQVAYLSSLPYLLAKEEAPVEVLAAEIRANRTDYDSIFVVRKDSDYKSLEDLEGKRMMFTSATSTSGYVMAYSRLVDEGLLEKGQDPGEFFSAVNYAGGYDRALLAVANEQADLCAVSYYTMEGPKADVYTTQETRDKLRILTRTSGVPTHLFAARSDMPADFKKALQNTILTLSVEMPDLFADVYGAAEFKAVDEDEHLRGAVKAMENTGLALNKFGK